MKASQSLDVIHTLSKGSHFYEEYATLIGLVSRYSPSGQEDEAVRWLVGRMRSLGYTQSYVDEVGNAIGIMGEGPRQVILLGHIDTVTGELPVRHEGDRLYGRGTVDAKGALAAFVDAVARLGARQGWQWMVIGAVGEESDSRGAYYVASHYRPDFAVVGEPCHWTRIGLGYKGSAWARITVTRQQAHTANGDPTACEQVVDIWSNVKTYASQYNSDKPRQFDQILPILNEMNSRQDGFTQWACLKIGVRLPPALSPEQWYACLEGLARGAQVERLGRAIPAWVCEKNTPLVRAFLSSIRSFGQAPNFVYKSGTADLNIVAPVWQCPMLVYGPGDSHLDHTPNEHVVLGEFSCAVQVLQKALLLLIGERSTQGVGS